MKFASCRADPNLESSYWHVPWHMSAWDSTLFTLRSRDTPAFFPETDEYPPQLNLDGQPKPLVRLAEALLYFFLHWPREVWKR